MSLTKQDYSNIYEQFQAPVSPGIDCGKFCSPLNEGEPVCCTTQHAIPLVDKAEYKLLRSRTKMWTKLEPFDQHSKKVIDDHAASCVAVECNGAKYCERDNRSLACRAFPFFPYLNKNKEIIGVSIYWEFKDRCWVMSNLKYVNAGYIKELIDAYRYIFKKDSEEENAFFNQSVTMRRLFSRKKWSIPILDEQGKSHIILPKSNNLTSIQSSKLEKYFPFNSLKNYKNEVNSLNGSSIGLSLIPK